LAEFSLINALPHDFNIFFMSGFVLIKYYDGFFTDEYRYANRRQLIKYDLLFELDSNNNNRAQPTSISSPMPILTFVNIILVVMIIYS